METLSHSNPVCFKCGKVRHFKKDYKVKGYYLNASDKLKDMLCDSMPNISKSKSIN